MVSMNMVEQAEAAFTSSCRQVLVVEDESSIRIAIAQMLRMSGFAVVEAGSGADALALARSASFDLVLSDIRLPGMDGHDTFRAIRRIHPGVPGIAMTGYADASSTEAARSAGFHTLLRKPFSFQSLLAAVQSALQEAPTV